LLRENAALKHVDESTCRCWRLYMAACVLEFESGEIGVYPLLASKRTTGTAAPPLTRRHRHPDTPTHEGHTS
jgi:cyclopropane-fatty-acyl-phospholipid synthase